MDPLIDSVIGTTDTTASIQASISGPDGYGARLMTHKVRMSDLTDQTLHSLGVFRCQRCECWRDGSQEFFDAGVCVHCCHDFTEVLI